ncbi:MAG: MGMT family protein [Bacteroidales bacterium]|jgi:methylated-DNA-protein-cysteine methyltransferase-like protein
MKDTGFFDSVFQVVRYIPYGRVTSYGAIARYLGSPQSARMVGWALNKSFDGKGFIPAHRVVNRTGLLTGKHYFGYSDTMKQLLESEGIRVDNDQILDFEQVFWDPVKEMPDVEG